MYCPGQQGKPSLPGTLGKAHPPLGLVYTIQRGLEKEGCAKAPGAFRPFEMSELHGRNSPGCFLTPMGLVKVFRRFK